MYQQLIRVGAARFTGRHKEVTEALEIQNQEKQNQEKHRLLGQILVDNDCISEKQVTEILDYMDQQLVFMLSVGR